MVNVPGALLARPDTPTTNGGHSDDEAASITSSPGAKERRERVEASLSGRALGETPERSSHSAKAAPSITE